MASERVQRQIDRLAVNLEVEAVIDTDSTQLAPAAREPTSLLSSALEWRCIGGPHRRGRVVAVAGDPSDPNVFYFGEHPGMTCRFRRME